MTQHIRRSNVRLTATVCRNNAPVVVTMPEDSQSVVSRDNPYVYHVGINPIQKGIRQDSLRVRGTVFHAGVPAIAGTSLRGTLRDRITTVYLSDLNWEGQTFYSQALNYKGGIKPAGKERISDKLKVRKHSPLLSLLGACDPGFIQGRLNVGYMFLKDDPENREFQLQKFSAQRGVASDRNSQIEQLEPDEVTDAAKKDLKARKKELEAKKKELEKSLRTTNDPAEKDAIKNEIKAAAKAYETLRDDHREEHGSEVELRFITKAEDITLGIPAHREFENTLILEDATDEELGLFFRGMLDVGSRALKLGGWGARGAGGWFDLVYSVEFYENGEYVLDGTTIEPGQRAAECIAAYEDGLQEGRYLFDVKSLLSIPDQDEETDEEEEEAELA